MSLEAAMKTFVEGNATIVAALGGDSKRFRPIRSRAGTDFPYAEFVVIDDDVGRVSEGHSDESDALVQIDAYAHEDDFASAVTLRDALFQEFSQNFRGSISGIHVVSCWREGISQMDDIPQHGKANAPYRISQDFSIGYYLNTD